jgi:hypothetical protein
MHRNRELDGSEACAGVTANTRTSVDDKLAHLVGDFLQVVDA